MSYRQSVAAAAGSLGLADGDGGVGSALCRRQAPRCPLMPL